MLSKQPKDIKELDLEYLYNDFLQIGIFYKSKKCKGFVNNYLRCISNKVEEEGQ